ncbi:hypothetical protein FQR65_LT16246 [Abscondita terminalis]|nr:hypothetical protein FQR65_LT16246 [Abscondita terminalis]
MSKSVGHKRSANFDDEEEHKLIVLVKKYKSILECKLSDKNTKKGKQTRWEKVALEFNSDSSRWSNIKGIDEEVKDLLGVRIEGLDSEFDGDAENDNEETPITATVTGEDDIDIDNSIIIKDLICSPNNDIVFDHTYYLNEVTSERGSSEIFTSVAMPSYNLSDKKKEETLCINDEKLTVSSGSGLQKNVFLPPTSNVTELDNDDWSVYPPDKLRSKKSKLLTNHVNKRRRLKNTAIPSKKLPVRKFDRSAQLIDERATRRKKRNKNKAHTGTTQSTPDYDAATTLIQLSQVVPELPEIQIPPNIKTYEDKGVQVNTYDEFHKFDIVKTVLDSEYRLKFCTGVNNLKLFIMSLQ